MLNDQQNFIFYQKSHKKPTVTSFSNKNDIKNQPSPKTHEHQRRRTIEGRRKHESRKTRVERREQRNERSAVRWEECKATERARQGSVWGFFSAKLQMPLTLHAELKKVIFLLHQLCQMKVMPHIGVKITLLLYISRLARLLLTNVVI